MMLESPNRLKRSRKQLERKESDGERNRHENAFLSLQDRILECNLIEKLNMAEELTHLGLSADAIGRILNIERKDEMDDCPS